MSIRRAVAIGRPRPRAAWVGFVTAESGYRLVFGEPDDRLRTPRGDDRSNRLDLLLVAQAYFTEALEDPPPELEATHADLAALLRWLAETERDPQLRRAIREAVDAVDDGLAGEAVAAALARAATQMSGEQVETVDPLDLLLGRYRERPD